MADPTRVDRLPPHSLEAERGVLGCIMWDPSGILPEAEARFPALEVFYDLRNRLIFEQMVKLVRGGRALDSITLTERLRAGDLMEKVGGDTYVAGLQDATPSAANFEFYADILDEKFVQRRMVQVCSRAVGQIYEAIGNADAVIDQIERDVMQVSQLRNADDRSRHISLAGAEVEELLANYARGRGMIAGIQTRFGYLDKVLGGLHPGEMTILAGRPGTGKTSLAMNLAENIAFEAKVPVGVLSMEMNEVDLCLRVMCARRRVNFHQIRTGFASNEDLDSLHAVAADIKAVPIYIDDTPALECLQLRARARRMVNRYGIRVLFIDYLQLAHSRHANNQTERVTHVSETIKSIARDLNIPVVALSQLSREFEKEGNRKPRLSDLRDSGAVEQDADAVWMLYRRKVLDDDGKAIDFNDVKRLHLPLPINILIAKQRNGPSDHDVGMLFFRQFMRFEDEYQNRGRRGTAPLENQTPL